MCLSDIKASSASNEKTTGCVYQYPALCIGFQLRISAEWVVMDLSQHLNTITSHGLNLCSLAGAKTVWQVNTGSKITVIS